MRKKCPQGNHAYFWAYGGDLLFVVFVCSTALGVVLAHLGVSWAGWVLLFPVLLLIAAFVLMFLGAIFR